MGRQFKPLDADIGVTQRIAAGQGRGHQVQPDRRAAVAVAGDIDPRAAFQPVSARAPDQRVIAIAADQDIGTVAAVDPVIAVLAPDHVALPVPDQRIVKA